MAKLSDSVYLVFVGPERYLVAVDLNEPQTPSRFNEIISAHRGEQGIFEELARSSPDEAMSAALSPINIARASHGLLDRARIRSYVAAERPVVVDGDKVVAFRPKAAVVQNG